MSAGKARALWSQAPWTLQLYVGVGALLALLNVAVNRTAYQVIAGALFLALSYFLLSGKRWSWILLLVGTSLTFVLWLAAFRLPALYNLVALALLLAPPTRRHFARGSGARPGDDGLLAPHSD